MNIKNKIKKMSKIYMIMLVMAFTLTGILIAAIPAYAWFNSQRRIAELHKIKYPNALFINAAYREDQVYFNLDTIDINEVERDWRGNVIKTLDENNNPVAQIITNKQYVFSVSGSNTEEFDLQLAHTNNNKFTYKIYIGTPISKTAYDAMNDNQKNNCVKYLTHPGKNTENVELIIDNEILPDDNGYLYFQRGTQLEGAPTNGTTTNSINGQYVNNANNTNKLAKNDDDYYADTYGIYASVQELAIPLYWQARHLPTSLNENEVSNKKDFCRYFILEITWDRNEQSGNETKESDMVYLSVKRSE